MKNRFTNFWVISCILEFLVHSKYTLTRLWGENFFFFKYSEWGVKKSVFLYRFQKCTFDFSKKGIQKILPNNWFFRQFFGKHFFWVHFLLRSNFIFCIPRAICEGKKFSLIKESTCTFIKNSKMQATTKYKEVFYKQVLEFHHPSKICASKWLVPTTESRLPLRTYLFRVYCCIVFLRILVMQNTMSFLLIDISNENCITLVSNATKKNLHIFSD